MIPEYEELLEDLLIQVEDLIGFCERNRGLDPEDILETLYEMQKKLNNAIGEV